jgi:hypothetical protein
VRPDAVVHDLMEVVDLAACRRGNFSPNEIDGTLVPA